MTVTEAKKDDANKYRIALTGYASFNHKNKISKQVLTSRYEEACAALSKINNDNAASQYKEFVEKYQQIIDICNQYKSLNATLHENGNDGILDYLEFDIIEKQKGYENIREQIDKLDKIYESMIIYMDTILPPWILGPIFEIPLYLISEYGNDLGNDIVQQALKEGIKTAGNISVSRGRLKEQNSLGVKVEIIQPKKNQKNIKKFLIVN